MDRTVSIGPCLRFQIVSDLGPHGFGSWIPVKDSKKLPFLTANFDSCVEDWPVLHFDHQVLSGVVQQGILQFAPK